MRYLFASILSFCFLQAHTCTTFLLHQGNDLVFGRNYDWVTGNGIIHTNQRGIAKHSATKGYEKALTWTSRYGSITFNQYGKEFPTGGMNETGLVVELMWLDDSRYPSEDNRPAISVLQWIQYQLDCHKTVEEVIASDQFLRINDKIPLHYLIADSSGTSATIEFLAGKMVVHKGDDLRLPVLANETYTRSLKALNARETDNNNSHTRFATACRLLSRYQESPQNQPVTENAFKILDAVAQGDFTKWQIVYDITQKRILYKTNKHQAIRSFSFRDLDLNCHSPAMMFDINQGQAGDITNFFIPYNAAANLESIATSVKESNDRIRVTQQSVQDQSYFLETLKCLN